MWSPTREVVVEMDEKTRKDKKARENQVALLKLSATVQKNFTPSTSKEERRTEKSKSKDQEEGQNQKQKSQRNQEPKKSKRPKKEVLKGMAVSILSESNGNYTFQRVTGSAGDT